jgi:cystathionine gamma-lyase
MNLLKLKCVNSVECCLPILAILNSKKVLNEIKIFTLAESLGGVESLISHPASMSHASVPKVERDKMGLTESLLIFFVGIEDIEHLIADVEEELK